jgi:hypothetical protein
LIISSEVMISVNGSLMDSGSVKNVSINNVSSKYNNNKPYFLSFSYYSFTVNNTSLIFPDRVSLKDIIEFVIS